MQRYYSSSFVFLIALFLLAVPAYANWYDAKGLGDVSISCPKRNFVFYSGEPIVLQCKQPYDSFEVRDYWGNIVDSGKDLSSVKVGKVGWYKVYLRFANKPDLIGVTTFAVFRNDPRFPALPSKDTPGGWYPEDEVMRGVTGMGPQRHQMDIAPAKIEKSMKSLDEDIKLDERFYMPFDPVRQRALLTSFGSGTKDSNAVSEVVRRFQGSVKYWEPRNEPNFGSTGKDFAEKELPEFYKTVKSVDPNLKVLAPGTVGIGPQLLPWLDEFFKAGGAQYMDGFSFHAYNVGNGDPFLFRKAFTSLDALLKKYNLEKIEKWQTEQGAFAACFGVYEPRMQSRWMMLEVMFFEQNGIPKEHNHLWYDKSHGFWDMPTWWENTDSSLNPLAVQMRVWSEELFGKKFVKAFDFGTPGNNLYLGSLFSGHDGNLVVLMSTGEPKALVEVNVQNATKVKVVDCFGVVTEKPVKNKKLRLELSELPTYVELDPNASISVNPTSWGANLACQNGVTVTASAKADAPASRMNNGEVETWYWDLNPATGQWRSANPTFPVTIDVDLHKPQTISHAVIYAGPVWQGCGSLLDYDLQYEKNGQWITIDHVVEQPKTLAAISPVTRTSVDTFYNERWLFNHQFAPITTEKIRLFIRNSTWGGVPDELAHAAGGHGDKTHSLTVREIELYGGGK